jgi:hypothetical protein
MLDREPVAGPFDYGMTVDGVRVVVLDSRGPRDPGGVLSDEQISGLRDLCRTGAELLVIATRRFRWIRNGWTAGGRLPAASPRQCSWTTASSSLKPLRPLQLRLQQRGTGRS